MKRIAAIDYLWVAVDVMQLQVYLSLLIYQSCDMRSGEVAASVGHSCAPTCFLLQGQGYWVEVVFLVEVVAPQDYIWLVVDAMAVKVYLSLVV